MGKKKKRKGSKEENTKSNPAVKTCNLDSLYKYLDLASPSDQIYSRPCKKDTGRPICSKKELQDQPGQLYNFQTQA